MLASTARIYAQVRYTAETVVTWVGDDNFHLPPQTSDWPGFTLNFRAHPFINAEIGAHNPSTPTPSIHLSLQRLHIDPAAEGLFEDGAFPAQNSHARTG